MAQSAAACLRAIDTTTAAAAPGVLAVFTADDFADCDRYFGPAYKDQPILAIERVAEVEPQQGLFRPLADEFLHDFLRLGRPAGADQ